MKLISIIILFFSTCSISAQNNFPKSWGMERFCHLWDSETEFYLPNYEKYSDSIIEYEFYEKVGIPTSSVEDMLNFYFQLYSSVRFFTYTDIFNFVIGREFTFSRRTIPASVIRILHNNKGVIEGYYNMRGYGDVVFPKDLVKKWNVKYLFNGDKMDMSVYSEMQGSREIVFFQRKDGIPKIKKEDIYKCLFFQNIIAVEKLTSPYPDLNKRYDLIVKGSADAKIVDRIKEITGFIEKINGRWSYNIIDERKSYKFDFINRHGVIAAGIATEILKANSYIYSEPFTKEMLDLVAEKKIDYFYPMQFIYFDSASGSLVLMKRYEFISETPKGLRFNPGGYSYCTDSDAEFSGKSITFKNIYKGSSYEIKWELSDCGNKISEYVKNGSDWVLYAVFQREIL